MPNNATSYTTVLMGMPVTVRIVGRAPRRSFEAVFDLFAAVDTQYSTYKPGSEVSRVNAGLAGDAWSEALRAVLALCEQTKQQTQGYFDVWHDGRLDPSGLVKGWAIQRASELLRRRGHEDFYIDAGGDIQTSGHNAAGEPWRVGVRNPFSRDEIVKVLYLSGEGVATSGASIRGDHIYNPLTPGTAPRALASITVVGPNIYEADRFATAAYAMGQRGAAFVDALDGLEAYAIDRHGMATLTSGLARYIAV